jgi:SAM-dependent methyltransferase
MYSLSAELYDVIYQGKDYLSDANKLKNLLGSGRQSSGKTLLDVACGTGCHLQQFADEFDCMGVELTQEMAELARKKLPQVPIHIGDMLDFDLRREFDIVLCLFSSIGYMKTFAELRTAAENLMRHLAPGGILIVEPWLRSDTYTAGFLSASLVDLPELKICRMMRSEREGSLSIMDMHHMVTRPSGVTYFVERHEMGLFTDQEYVEAFSAKGFRAKMSTESLTQERGLILVTREA